MKSLAQRVMDLAEQQELLDGKSIGELRKQVAQSKFVITPEAIAKVLVDHGHLTPFQARKLVSQALANEPDPVEERVAEKPKPRRTQPEEDLTFADPADRPRPAPRQEIVDLEPLETDPASRPSAKKPVSKPIEPTSKPAGPQHRSERGRQENRPAELKQPVEGSTAEDFVDLEPVEPSPQARGNRWKTDKAAMNETIELTPIDLSAPSPLDALPPDLAPLDDLFGGDPLASPAIGPIASQPVTAPLQPARTGTAPPDSTPILQRQQKNVWDSPLMLIGGGALGVILVIFALLFYALTRGSAAELFAKGEEEYRNASYSNAIGIYEQFLKQYPDDPNAGLARVRRAMATLRQVTDDGKNPRLGLETAQQVLPEIEKEEQFGEARGELASILPNIADGFATQAAQAKDSARKGELVKLAGEALTLVNNPAYLPASLRKDRESQILRTVDKLRSAERGIQQDKDLAAAVAQIGTATEKGNAAAAYQAQADLLRTYPGLASNMQLVAAVRRVGEKEQQLVSTSTGGPESITADSPPASETAIISFREKSAAAASVQPVFLLIEGAVYGVDAQTGRVLWRRFVGYESTNQPLAVTASGASDVSLIDSRQHELIRLKGTTGELVWRQKLSGDALGPVLAGNRLLVTMLEGSVIALDAATGKIAISAKLPQRAEVAPAVRQSRVYQLGEHSTLFVLDAGSLACTETFYLGHRAGEVLVPPVAVLDQLLVIRSPADDYSEIQVLGPDAKKQLAIFGKPHRLKGRIVTPLTVSASRAAAVSDLGQVAVYEVDPASTEHLRQIVGLDATESSPREIYCELQQNRLWLANHRSEMFEVQSSLSQLARRWTQNHDDVFLGPLHLQGDMLVQIRRRSGIAGVLVEGCRAGTSGDPIWTTHVAAPITAMLASEARQAVDVLTAEGRLYSISNSQFSAGQLDEARFSPRAAGIQIFDDPAISPDGQTLVWTETSVGGRAFIYDVKTGGDPATVSLPAAAAAPAVPLGADIVAPLTNGAVSLVSRDATAAKAAPFMPPLSPDALPLWTKPAAFADGKSILISDGRGAVYAVTKRDGAKPQLVSPPEATRTTDPVISSLVLAGSGAIGVMRQQSTDALVGFDSRGASLFEPVPLQGRVQFGPFAVGGLVFVFAEPDGLVCLSTDGKIRWQQPPERGVPAGAPLACSDGDLLVAYQSGVVCRLDAATGNTLAQHEIGEPLLGPGCILGSQVYLAGSDGVIHRIPLPARP
jgi:outer membrane protein assembly factor BamB